jgi:cytoplasmic iron level regulating protein YaaA (DUF328/UPF0246 family)
MPTMIILLHSSKTMRSSPDESVRLRPPRLLEKAERLDTYLKTLSPAQLEKVMGISTALAKKTHALIAAWTTEPKRQSLAIDSFLGDIYSGLQAPSFSTDDRDYADQTLYILSGLYGIIRPYDGICPYRLEMGYQLPDPAFASLYKYWGDSIASCLPKKGLIVNLAAEEYAKTITPFVDASRLIVPKFLTVSPQSGEPAFVVVHAKIARGAFARWLITSRIDDAQALSEFHDLGYRFDQKLSTAGSPVFVCQVFGGKGLSIRLR